MLSESEKGTGIALGLPVTVYGEKASAVALEESVEPRGTKLLAPSVEVAQAEGTLVLLVDDQPTNRMILRKQLNALGYACETAGDGEQALAMWSSARFALLLTDCNMPGMSGLELSRRVRQREVTGGQRRMPIVACSGNSLSGDVQACLDAGMDDFLAKPTSLLTLADKVGRWLPLRRKPVTRPTPPANVTSSGPVDPVVLQGMTQGKPAAVCRILAHFHRANHVDATALQTALDNDDLPTMTRAAHRIKGASGLIGARALASVCHRIEDAARTGDLHAATLLRVQLDHELERLNAYVTAQRS